MDFDDITGLIERFEEINDETLRTHNLPVEAYTTAGGRRAPAPRSRGGADPGHLQGGRGGRRGGG